MTLTQTEREAFAAMKADPNCDTHRRWIEARRALQSHIRDSGIKLQADSSLYWRSRPCWRSGSSSRRSPASSPS